MRLIYIAIFEKVLDTMDDVQEDLPQLTPYTQQQSPQFSYLISQTQATRQYTIKMLVYKLVIHIKQTEICFDLNFRLVNILYSKELEDPKQIDTVEYLRTLSDLKLFYGPEFRLYLLKGMGCLTSQKKIEEKITPQDFKIIWNKCLKTDSIVLNASKKKHHPVFQQIAKDIDRTYPGHPFFNSPENKICFEKVLKAFALEFPKVGYTQGLNFLAGFLLISGFNQQESLKTLIAMCIHPQLMLIGLYEDDFPLCKLYCSLFWLLIKKISPTAYDALKAANLPDELWIFQWFITFFIYSFPLSYIQHFLNFIVIKRYFAGVRLAVAIVQCLQKHISGIGGREDGFLECFQLIKTQEFCKKFLPIEQIIKKAQRVKKQTIVGCLHQSRENNWYRHYFSLKSPDWQKKYRKMMQSLRHQREHFSGQNDLSLRYTRLASSMNVIDAIQQSMTKMFENRLFRSSYDRNTVFFSIMSIKRCNSMDLIGTYNSK